MTEPAAIAVTDRPDEDAKRRVLEGLRAHNDAFLGRADGREIGALATDGPGGPLVGGLIGETGRGFLHVDLLWVAPEHRGRGLGSRLLRAAEAEALARGCAGAWVGTYDFQARPFYERHGYRVVGTLEGFANGHKSFFLSKRLGGPGPDGGTPVTVRRIVPNIAAADPGAARRFYGDVLGMRVVMDHGWIVTFAAGEGDGTAQPQLSVAAEGGSGTPVPDLSIEVDDLAAVHRRAAAAGLAVEYGPTREPWGVTRFYVRDPFGRLVNVLAHE